MIRLLSDHHVFYLHPHMSPGWLDSEPLTVINSVKKCPQSQSFILVSPQKTNKNYLDII